MALLGRLDDFRKIGVPIQCDVDDARLLQGFHNRKAKIIKEIFVKNVDTEDL